MSAGRVLFYVFTLALTATAVLVALLGATFAPVLLCALVAYLAVILVGVLVPQLAMFAPVLVRLDTTATDIALTFDDGPHPVSTREVLAVLERFGAKATFFVLGEKVRAAPDVLREIVAAGHAVGIHGDWHDRMFSFRHPARIVADIERARDAVATVTGQRPTLLRPPLGHISPRTALAARRLGLTLVGWSVRGRDGLAGATSAAVERRVASGLRPGAIVLLHDAAERGDRVPAGVAALPAILAEASRLGLRPIPLEVSRVTS